MKYRLKYILKYSTHSSEKEIVIKNCDSKKHAKSKFFKYMAKKKKNAIAKILEINDGTDDSEDQILNDIKNMFGMK